jgi:hypothetical protein
MKERAIGVLDTWLLITDDSHSETGIPEGFGALHRNTGIPEGLVSETEAKFPRLQILLAKKTPVHRKG